MFDRIKFIFAAKKIFRSWGGDPKNPTINEMIVACPIIKIQKNRGNSFIFKNNYVCADAIIVLCAYAIKILKGTGAPDNITSDIKSKAISAIQSEFNISGKELLELQFNRFSYFGKLLDKHEEDISPVIEEAILLFSHDLHHNRYVEYEENSPLIIMGIFEQHRIETEALSFFNVALKLVTDTLRQYFD